jgi:hypothetical protein
MISEIPDWAHDSVVGEPVPTTKALPAVKKPPVAQRLNVTSEYDAALLGNDITDVVAEGRVLREEAEGFIDWCRVMGESTAASSWGPIQQDCAAAWRKRHRALAAKLKSDIEAKCQNPTRIMEHIFGERYRGQYDADVTKAARAELGI